MHENIKNLVMTTTQEIVILFFLLQYNISLATHDQAKLNEREKSVRSL